MKIRYVGKKISRKRGCPVCGSRGRTEYRIATKNEYYLPSGKIITVRIGQEIELEDHEANFLLSLGDEFDVFGTTS